MNDSLPGNSGDTDGDFDLSGFLDDSDTDDSASSKPKGLTGNPTAGRAGALKPDIGTLGSSKPKISKPVSAKPSASISKGHRDIKSAPIERAPAPTERKTNFREGNNPRQGNSDRQGGADRQRISDRQGNGYVSRGGSSDRGQADRRGGFSDRGDARSSRGPARGPSSVHHIPPRIVERASEIHKPVSVIVKPFLPLKTDKGRWKESRFLLEGAKNIADVLAVSTGTLRTVLVTDEFEDQELLTLIKKNRIDIIKVTQDDLRALADTESPQGILAIADFATLRPDWNTARYVTLLDGVQDPGNVGAILRTSLALGMDAVVVGKGSCDPYNPKVVRSSVGALMRLPFETGEDLGSKMEFLRQKGFSIVATSSHAKLTLDQAKLRKKVALIVGNEGAGTGAQYQDMADAVVKIPLKNKVESLNVSVAHGILTYQLIHGRA